MGGCVPSGPEAFDTVCSCQRFMFRIPTLIIRLLNNVNMTEILTINVRVVVVECTGESVEELINHPTHNLGYVGVRER